MMAIWRRGWHFVHFGGCSVLWSDRWLRYISSGGYFIHTLALARAAGGADGIHRNGTIDYLVDRKQVKTYSS
jgi:hypothetical protein